MNRIIAITLMSMSAMLLSACERQGPMEEAGEDIDEAVDDVADAVDDDESRR
jgi:predicted small secreted protein